MGWGPLRQHQPGSSSQGPGHQPTPWGGQGRGCQGRAGPADWEGAWQVLCGPDACIAPEVPSLFTPRKWQAQHHVFLEGALREGMDCPKVLRRAACTPNWLTSSLAPWGLSLLPPEQSHPPLPHPDHPVHCSTQDTDCLGFKWSLSLATQAMVPIRAFTVPAPELLLSVVCVSET